MTAIHPVEILRQQFVADDRKRGLSSVAWDQYLWLVIAGVVGTGVWLLKINTVAGAPVLTATSIITGLTFTMAMRFWERRIEIASAPHTPGYSERRRLIEKIGTQLIWTVLTGVVSTAWTGFALLVSGASIVAWATGVSAGLLAYQLLLVSKSLLDLYNSSIRLS